MGVGSKGKASSTTQSAISDGILTVDGKEIDTKIINTNTENTLHQLDKIFDKKKSLVKRESTNAVDDATTTVVTKSEAPKDKNTLTTKSLEMKDIPNEAEYTYSNNGIGYNYYGSKKKLEEMKTNDKKAMIRFITVLV